MGRWTALLTRPFRHLGPFLQSSGKQTEKYSSAGVSSLSTASAGQGLKDFNADGSLDETFAIGRGFIGTIYAIEMQPDGKILIGGNYSGGENIQALNAARLNPDGSFDADLNNGSDIISPAYSFAIQPDGKVLIGGQVYRVTGGISGMTRVHIDGSPDLSFRVPRSTAPPARSWFNRIIKWFLAVVSPFLLMDLHG